MAVNQHPHGEGVPHHENQEDVRAFEDVLKVCSGGTIVVCDVNFNPATRGWCIFEWDHTILHHGPDGLHMPLSREDRVTVVDSFDVEKAECFMPQDKEMILGLVRACLLVCGPCLQCSCVGCFCASSLCLKVTSPWLH